ncbi:MAG: HD domain-containing protein [Spirochaetales bacterium]
MIKRAIKNYIEKHILPIYDTFDKGHDSEHINEVIERSLRYAKNIDESLNIDMVYVVAAYHDYGMQIERKGHNFHSGKLLREDKNLKKWFNEEEIETMAQAVEDHSTSLNREPRSIYGKIVCDADKDDNLDRSLTRALEFCLSHFKDNSKEQHFEDTFKQMCLKYGDNQLVKFYLKDSQSEEYLRNIKALTKNKDLAFKKFEELWLELNK